MALSLGSGLAGALAGYGARELTRAWENAARERAHVNIKGGSPEDRVRVARAAIKVAGTERGAEMVAAGRQRYTNPVDLELNNENWNQFCPGDGRCGPGTPFSNPIYEGDPVIHLDPDASKNSVFVDPSSKSATGPWSQKVSQPQTLEASLAHEMGHAFTGAGDNDYNGMDYMENTILNENPVRIELGLPPRVEYYSP
jgi:hypothetical protein